MANLKEDLASLRIEHSARGGGGRRGGLLVAGLVLVLGAGATWFWSQRLQAAPVRTAAASARASNTVSPGAVLNASGYVTARRRATVSSKVTGKVMEIFVEEGKEVRRGQVLARLDDTQIRAELAVSRAQLEAARRAAVEDQARLREAELTLKRLNQLVKDGVVGLAEVDSADATVDSLKARIAMAQQQVLVAETQVNAKETDLTDMTVRAPFDGVAISKDAQPGEMISPVSAGGGFTRTGICTIVDMSSLEVEVDVSESYINRVKPNQPVEAVLDAYPDWRIPAHVITTVPSADRQKATVRVRIGFDADTETKGGKVDPRILPDMGVKVSFFNERAPTVQTAPARQVVMVPKAAVRSADGRSVVFIVKDERVERRAVTVGAADGDQIEIVSGVTTGERVVVEGHDALVDGARVKER